MTIFNESWKKWVETNLNSGCDKNLMYHDMIKAGFEHDFILKKLKLKSIDIKGQYNHLYIPRSIDFELSNAIIKVVDDFISEDECLDLQIHLNSKLKNTLNNIGSIPIGDPENNIINDLDKRLCDFLGVKCEYSSEVEGWSVLSGEKEINKPNLYMAHPELGNCSLLVVLFLNEPPEKNEIVFSETASKIKVSKGAMVIWESSERESKYENLEKLDIYPTSEGCQSIVFKKYYNHRAAFQKTPNEYIPAYTKQGFLKKRIPDYLFHKILSFYFDNINTTSSEIDRFHIKGKNNEVSSEIIELSDEIKIDIHESLHPLMEAWIGHQLEPTFVFGIRRYLDTSVLQNHRDREETHVASAILNIAQNVRKPWPLYIEDHHYNQHNILLNPGDMILYEGCKLKHGRPEPLDGDYFCNIFVHFKIKR